MQGKVCGDARIESSSLAETECGDVEVAQHVQTWTRCPRLGKHHERQGSMGFHDWESLTASCARRSRTSSSPTPVSRDSTVDQDSAGEERLSRLSPTRLARIPHLNAIRTASTATGMSSTRLCANDTAQAESSPKHIPTTTFSVAVGYGSCGCFSCALNH